MTISDKIEQYVENSKIRGKLAKWIKGSINVFITPISANIPDKEFLYSEIKRATEVWNKSLTTSGINLKLQITKSAQNADIIIHWVKVGRIYEGMCKYLSVINGELKKISIDIGLPNELSPKTTTNESIFFSMMHEFGHALGLGHGVEVDDVMFVPHQKNISVPSENDMYLLKQIYS
jgi:predicted Zn-dependent protease